MRALNTRVSRLHSRCCYLIPTMNVPCWSSWNSDLVCAWEREPHNMPHGPSSSYSLSSPLVVKDVLVKQNTCETEQIRSCTYAAVGLIHLCCIRKPLRQKRVAFATHGIFGAVRRYLACMRHVTCTRASQWSIHTLPSPCQACARYFICLTDYRSALAVRGRIVEATFHLPMQAI